MPALAISLKIKFVNKSYQKISKFKLWLLQKHEAVKAKSSDTSLIKQAIDQNEMSLQAKQDKVHIGHLNILFIEN